VSNISNAAHRGCFDVELAAIPGDASKLKEKEIETVNAVIKHYGGKTALWLSELTHAESPWKNARKGLKPGEMGNQEISHAAMAEYYGGLVQHG